MVEEVVKPKLTPAYTSSKLCEFIQIWSKDANINIYKQGENRTLYPF